MKGLMRHLPPLAPDYSGAVSVLFTLGGGIIINGADGCIGNVTGYDEPRFFDHPVHIYSSGLREIKAVAGDEEVLQRKVENSVGDKDVPFIVLLGTPNSAVIASDHRGVANILRKGRRIPVLTVNTTGIDTYEIGAANAYLELAKTFSEPMDEQSGINIIGASPMDYWSSRQVDAMTEALAGQGIHVRSVWGADNSLDNIRRSAGAKANLVVSWSGLKAARWMERRYKIPFVTGVPLGRQLTEELSYELMHLGSERPKKRNLLNERRMPSDSRQERVLVIGDQIWADSVRRYQQLEQNRNDVYTASFFSLHKSLKGDRDFFIESEKHLKELIADLKPDILMADPLCQIFLEDEKTEFVALPHLAVSSRLHWDHDRCYTGLNPDF